MPSKNKAIKKAAKHSIKRHNKTEHELLMEIQSKQRVDHSKEVIRRVFPYLSDLDSIYDAQTAVNALSGFILPHIENYLSKIKLSDLPIDLSNDEDTKVKIAVEALIKELQDEPAKQVSGTLDSLGGALAAYGADKFLKQPMNTVTVDDIVTK